MSNILATSEEYMSSDKRNRENLMTQNHIPTADLLTILSNNVNMSYGIPLLNLPSNGLQFHEALHLCLAGF
jgi:hypothetical protein